VKKGKKKSFEQCVEGLILFKKANLPTEELIADNGKIQPAIIVTGEAEDHPELTFHVLIDKN